jgi:hypothetical protein
MRTNGSRTLLAPYGPSTRAIPPSTCANGGHSARLFLTGSLRVAQVPIGANTLRARCTLHSSWVRQPFTWRSSSGRYGLLTNVFSLCGWPSRTNAGPRKEGNAMASRAIASVLCAVKRSRSTTYRFVVCIVVRYGSNICVDLVAPSRKEDRQISAKGVQHLRYLGRLAALVATQCQSLRRHAGYTHLAHRSNSC